MSAEWLCGISFWISLGAAVTTAFVWYFHGTLARTTGYIAFSASLILVGSIWVQVGRPPLSGAFESLSFMALMLTLLAIIPQPDPTSGPLLTCMIWVSVAVLLIILAWIPRQLNPDWFLYQYFWTRSFFLCRLTALVLLLYSSLIALSWPHAGQENGARNLMIHRSRRYLLTGTAVFLVGEMSGFYWCLVWRGDYWLWNRNFLESTMIFLLANAALHLPPRLAAFPKVLRVAYGLPGLMAMIVYLIHQITEAFL
ncbi:MAG: hypothetical protein V1793_08630 [Pseudomonadota bacterium]